MKHRTLGSLSRCSKEEIEAIRLALKYKNNLRALSEVKTEQGKIKIKSKQGLSVGAIVLLKELADKLNISKAIGFGRV